MLPLQQQTDVQPEIQDAGFPPRTPDSGFSAATVPEVTALRIHCTRAANDPHTSSHPCMEVDTHTQHISRVLRCWTPALVSMHVWKLIKMPGRL